MHVCVHVHGVCACAHVCVCMFVHVYVHAWVYVRVHTWCVCTHTVTWEKRNAGHETEMGSQD